jgi:hypothetical protein
MRFDASQQQHASSAFWRLLVADSAVLLVFAAKSIGLERERVIAHVERAWQSVQPGSVVQTQVLCVNEAGAELARRVEDA